MSRAIAMILTMSVAAGCASFQQNTPARDSIEKVGGQSMIVLYANDPVANSFSIDDGMYGATAGPSGVFNRDSDIRFHVYRPNHLSVAKQGRQSGHIIDLGSSSDLASRYGYSETVGGGQGFSSIAFRNGVITIFRDRQAQTFQPLAEADQLIDHFDPNSDSVSISIGHVYLARLVDAGESSFVKLMVVDFEPSRYVVLRWKKLSQSSS